MHAIQVARKTTFIQTIYEYHHNYYYKHGGRVGGGSTARLRHKRVVVVLAVLDRADGGRQAGLHGRAAEEALGVASIRER